MPRVWIRSVRAGGETESGTGSETMPAGREAVGSERDALFELAATTYSNFAAYQERATRAAGRTIPVMVLSKP